MRITPPSMVAALLACVVGSTLTLQARSDAADRLEAAAMAFEEVMGVPDKAIPRDLLQKGECLVLVPGVKRGAFIFGAKYGRGFLLCRRDDRSWSAPAAVRMEGGSFGLQIGGSETDVFMLVMNKRGEDRLLSNEFTLGGDASVAAGPLGRHTSAETDAAMRAEILSWSRSRGVFAGLALQGATLRQDDDANRELYGRALKNREIVHGKVAAPAEAARLMGLVRRY